MATDSSTLSTATPAGRNAQSAWFMLLAAAGYSFIPLAIMLSGSKDTPFLFGAGWRGGIALTYTLFLAACFPRLFFNLDAWRFAVRRLFSPYILLVMVAYFDVALFAMSVGYGLNIAVATMMMEISPMFYLLILWFAHRDEMGNPAVMGVRPSTVFFMLLGLTGITFVILSQKDFGGSQNDSANSLIYLGLLLALVSALITTLNGFSMRWGANLSVDLSESLAESTGYSQNSINLFSATLGGLIASMAVIPILLLFGLGFFGESLGTGESKSMESGTLLLIVAGAAVTHPVAGILWRMALLKAHDLSINAIDHIRPILCLLWLWPSGFIDVQVNYLVIGTATLITANLLIGFEAEIRWGFKSLILALGGCGAFVYFREDIYKFLGVDQSEWVSSAYFGWVALSATIFTLLLAFRVASMVSRTNSEEAMAFSVFRKLERLAQDGILDDGVREHAARVDAPRNQADLKESYTELRGYISQARVVDKETRQMLSEAESQLDTLVRSKQLGVVLGELFALVIFALMTVGVALLLRPDESHAFARLLVDLFAMLISSVVIFMTVNVWDLYHERAVRQVQKREEYGDYLVRFPDTERKASDLWLSVVVGIAMLVAYSGLLAHKWLGLFG